MENETYKEQANDLINLLERSENEKVISRVNIISNIKTLIKAGEYYREVAILSIKLKEEVDNSLIKLRTAMQ